MNREVPCSTGGEREMLNVPKSAGVGKLLGRIEALLEAQDALQRH
jgi:hypothetical protein